MPGCRASSSTRTTGITLACAPRTARATASAGADKPATKSVLRKVTLDFVTHNDNKDGDTRLDVEIVNRLSATSGTGIAVGFDLLSGEEFVDGGPVPQASAGRPATVTSR